jgi:hypothetical protein
VEWSFVELDGNMAFDKEKVEDKKSGQTGYCILDKF